jgi:hypothetical protein
MRGNRGMKGVGPERRLTASGRQRLAILTIYLLCLLALAAFPLGLFALYYVLVHAR